MPLTEKQTEYIRNAGKRWNFKVGAVRSGKTYCDFYLLPLRIRRAEEDGIIVLIGNTIGTLCRNILDPLRAMWGGQMVGNAGNNSDSVLLFGRKCYLIGAEKSTAAERLQGASVSYAYGDEVATWSEEVFEMLKSRLDKPSSRFDGTCNPAGPNHWLKKFLDSDADLYVQTYRIDDNPNLPEAFREGLKKEYAGTVYYDRLILGKWVAAEGGIYRPFLDKPENFDATYAEIERKNPVRISCGVDFGGTKSATSFVALGFPERGSEVYALESEKLTGEYDAETLCERFGDFLLALSDRYPQAPCTVYCDNAEPVLIRTLRQSVSMLSLPVSVRGALKIPIRERIRLTLRLMAKGTLFLSPGCRTLREAFTGAVWKTGCRGDERLDDGTSDIDTLDAFEYALEREHSRLTRVGGDSDVG